MEPLPKPIGESYTADDFYMITCPEWPPRASGLGLEPAKALSLSLGWGAVRGVEGYSQY